MTDTHFYLLLLIVLSAFFSVSEIALAAARRLRLQQWADEGNLAASQVLALQAQPGHFFTVVQIGLNGVAILAGILGEPAFTATFSKLLAPWVPAANLPQVSFVLSFLTVTALFILLADLIPKRLAMMLPEEIAIRVVRPMRLCLLLFKPLVWLFDGLANSLLRLLRLPTERQDKITPDDVFAMVSAGAQAGVVRQQEHHLIENVFELDTRTVPSAMTARDSIVYFDRGDDEQTIQEKIATHPHAKFLVCDGAIDAVIGYVDTKDILLRMINRQPLVLGPEIVKSPLIIPDTLTLSEALESFRGSRQDFAVILNEYALVVGLITLNDVMSTLMGDLVHQFMEEQIVQRDEQSWLVEGGTPIEDVMRALDIESFPEWENYETIAGFMMYMLRKIPKRTDAVSFAGYKFEVVDIDNYKIDQLLVTRLPLPRPDASPITP